jgi:hypothetical protein
MVEACRMHKQVIANVIKQAGLWLASFLVIGACAGINTADQSAATSSEDDSKRVTFEVTGSYLTSTGSGYLSGENRIDWVAGNPIFQCNLIVTLISESSSYEKVIVNAIINSESSASLPGFLHFGDSGTTIVRDLNPGDYYFDVNSTCSSWRLAAIPSW